MSEPNICIVHPNPGPQCETFIRAHIDRLPGVASVLHGGHMPLYDMNGRELHPGLPQDFRLLFSPDGKPHTALHEKAAKNIADHLEASNIQVALAEYGPTGVAMMEPCRIAGIPLVVHFHGYDASIRDVLKKYEEGYERLFGFASGIIAVSEKMRKDLIALGAPSAKLYQNPYGVDLDLFCRADPSRAKPMFVGVGRFVEKKAPHLTISAFARTLGKAPDAELTLIGDGPLREECVGLVEKLGIETRVRLPGELGHEEVAEFMKGCRAFVQHSMTARNGDSEGTPVSVLEACASGLPVIASNHAGISDAVVHCETGYLFEEGDVPVMADYMAELASDSGKAARMGLAGRRRIEEHYSMGKSIGRLARFLDETASKSKP